MGGWLHEDLAREARIDGKHAHRNGEPVTENPYPAATFERRHWRDGWRCAERFAADAVRRPAAAAE